MSVFPRPPLAIYRWATGFARSTPPPLLEENGVGGVGGGGLFFENVPLIYFRCIFVSAITHTPIFRSRLRRSQATVLSL